MKWLEIPAHRVLEVERHELTNEFGIYDKAGEKLCYRGTPYLFFRKKDGKRFKRAQFAHFEAQPEQISFICRRSEASLISDSGVLDHETTIPKG